MKKITLYIAILFSVLGVFYGCEMFGLLNITYLRYLARLAPLQEDNVAPLIGNWVVMSIYIVGCVGVIAYWLQRKWGIRLIMFFLSVVAINCLYTMLLSIVMTIHPPGDLYVGELVVPGPSGMEFVPFVVAHFLYAAFAVVALRMAGYFQPANGRNAVATSKRFWTYLIDVVVISQVLFAKLPFTWVKYVSETEQVQMMTVGFVHILLYYMVFENFLQRTPGKFLTNTMVVRQSGTKASPLAVLGRTLIRLIPLEGISFLFNANWHDRWSKTMVTTDTLLAEPKYKP